MKPLSTNALLAPRKLPLTDTVCARPAVMPDLVTLTGQSTAAGLVTGWTVVLALARPPVVILKMGLLITGSAMTSYTGPPHHQR